MVRQFSALACAIALAACDDAGGAERLGTFPGGPYDPVTAVRICATTNAEAKAGRLSRLSDIQVRNGTCIVSKAAVEGLGRGSGAQEGECIQATRSMMAEFRRRFPSETVSDVAGKC